MFVQLGLFFVVFVTENAEELQNNWIVLKYGMQFKYKYVNAHYIE